MGIYQHPCIDGLIIPIVLNKFGKNQTKSKTHHRQQGDPTMNCGEHQYLELVKNLTRTSMIRELLGQCFGLMQNYKMILVLNGRHFHMLD